MVNLLYPAPTVGTESFLTSDKHFFPMISEDGNQNKCQAFPQLV